MPAAEDITVFTYRGAPVSVAEVLAAAAVRGDLQAPAAHQAWVDACVGTAEAEGGEMPEADLDAAVGRFRYERDLISAEETEAWLAARGLDADDLAQHFAGEHWWQQLKSRVPPPADRPGEAGRWSQLAPGLFFSGGFAPLAQALAQRLAAAAAAPTTPGPDERRRERRNFLHRNGLEEAQVAGWLSTVGRSPAWLDAMLEREIAFGEFASGAISAPALAPALAAVRLPLTRVEVERVEFDTLDAQREAELCVREDGLTLEQVAHESLFPFHRQTAFAEDLPAAEREAFLFARLGDLLRLNSPTGEFQVARVVVRAPPTLEDPEVRRRLGERVLAAALADSAGTDLHWIISP